MLKYSSMRQCPRQLVMGDGGVQDKLSMKGVHIMPSAGQALPRRQHDRGLFSPHQADQALGISNWEALNCRTSRVKVTAMRLACGFIWQRAL